MKFNCGCSFDKANKLDWEKINLDCSATWDMIGQGLTKGVFQLEKSLGRNWCKKLKPRSILELADVVSLIRPGCLEAPFREDDNGKFLSITETYRRIKNGELEEEYIHDSLRPILKKTHGVPVYQEQIMEICREFAGFTLLEADDTRKAVGKKLAAKMKQVEEKFTAGALRLGRDEATAKMIFSWIDKFSSYGFNLSHAVGYAIVGYQTAYSKVHFPTQFFKSRLIHSSGKPDQMDEIKQLVNEARLFGIDVIIPNVNVLNTEFEFVGDKIVFGLGHIKNVGPSAIPDIEPLRGSVSEAELFLRLFSDDCKVKKNVTEALIKSGALDFCLEDRVRTLGRFRMLGVLTGREVGWLLQNPEILNANASDWLKGLVAAKIPRPLDKRVAKITEAWGVIRKELGGNRVKLSLAYEKFHLGMAISGSETELYSNEKINMNCRDFLRLRNGTRVNLGVLIEEVSRKDDRRGQPMAFLKISDDSYMLDSVVVFSSVYQKCGWILEEGKVLLVSGKKQDASLLVDNIEHI